MKYNEFLDVHSKDCSFNKRDCLNFADFPIEILVQHQQMFQDYERTNQNQAVHLKD